ncbi:class I SAM-dependent methyltransferase [Tenacibaculum finnmarkense]|uniref:class I SAM-dependent methyltransferase n=1 Tax=Tenacibaculum finnmarkense TaxID=2781243 RepID=UPI00187BC11D|nr:class I SAM-dependent methyltransferase [Tenacibaculum finnmarkense]MBE7692669.1 methyltransferase domain-containing protein [Tenacibaculum finnmarkense genomovar finnmarkense]MCD8447109.1 class I SAM-dependent methyltransferase [Tenacibaculum finnmarkense genomovar finnmarkense]MCG8805375.1 class I SAM-dependent methyltransferase [Tenacibaculum finnmarkense]MCG8856654.1 class I SAM-dependent methyltransferase [Tenacibaculum finnmarkense]
MNNLTTNPKPPKTPWPTKDAMQQVYELNLWGNNNTAFYSGAGSHEIEIVTPYLSVVSSFLKSFETPLIVCDLGCGDFNIGKELVTHTKQYIAADIVPELIIYNTEKFKNPNLTFQTLDIAKDTLPTADCVILRQVLQHLSNDEVQEVLAKLSNYKYVILTEHLPSAEFIPNKDIISGQGIRIKKKSGLAILKAPFHFQVKEEKELLSVVLEDKKGIIVTTLYTVF